MATKENWLEYFEMLNDRKPTFQEYQEALHNGEIDPPADETAEQSTVVAEPISTASESVSAMLSEKALEPVDRVYDSEESRYSSESESLQNEESQSFSAPEKAQTTENCTHQNCFTDEIMALSGKCYTLKICTDCGKIEVVF
ncbi:hypothetical protein [Lactovum odontotermitis]